MKFQPHVTSCQLVACSLQREFLTVYKSNGSVYSITETQKKRFSLKTEAFLVAQTVKNLPAMLETQVYSLDREDPLEKGMTTHSSILAWKIPWTEEPGGL